MTRVSLFELNAIGKPDEKSVRDLCRLALCEESVTLLHMSDVYSTALFFERPPPKRRR